MMCHDLNSTSICLLHHSSSHDHLHDDKHPTPNSIHKLSHIITAQCDDYHLLTHDQQLHEQFIDPSTQDRKVYCFMHINYIISSINIRRTYITP